MASSDRRHAEELLLIFGQLGATITDALHARVDPQFTSNVEVLVIVQLDLHGPQRPSDIAALAGMTSGGVTKLLDRLEAHDLIARSYGLDRSDRRSATVEITPEGRRLAGLLTEGLISRMDAVREALARISKVVQPADD